MTRQAWWQCLPPTIRRDRALRKTQLLYLSTFCSFKTDLDCVVVLGLGRWESLFTPNGNPLPVFDWESLFKIQKPCCRCWKSTKVTFWNLIKKTKPNDTIIGAMVLVLSSLTSLKHEKECETKIVIRTPSRGKSSQNSRNQLHLGHSSWK